MRCSLLARFAGIACLIGGLLFFLDFTVIGWALKTNLPSSAGPVAGLMRALLWGAAALALTGGAGGLHLAGATGDGWREKLGLCGVFFNLLGAASYIAGTIFIYNFPDRATKQIFTPLGSLLLTIGMLKLAAAVFGAGVWRGWRRFVPLAVALYFPVQLPLQIIFFLGQGRGPNPLLLGAWGICWALLGAALWSDGARDEVFELAPHSV